MIFVCLFVRLLVCLFFFFLGGGGRGTWGGGGGGGGGGVVRASVLLFVLSSFVIYILCLFHFTFFHSFKFDENQLYKFSCVMFLWCYYCICMFEYNVD